MERPEAPAPLRGLRVLVTRPREQADSLCHHIRCAGGVPVAFPALEIAGPRDPEAARAGFRDPERFARVIFTSANAVAQAAKLVGSLGRWLPVGRAVAVGPATALALSSEGVSEVITPRERHDSEGLLGLQALAAPAVRGREILVVSGEGGRGLVAEGLTGRGARVSVVEVYRRVRPATDPGPVVRSLGQGKLDAVVVTSGEAVRNLFEMLGREGAERLRDVRFACLAPRVAVAARRLGVRLEPLVATRASDEGIVDALVRWRSAAGT